MGVGESRGGGDRLLTRGRVIAGIASATVVVAGGLLGGARKLIEVLDAPSEVRAVRVALDSARAALEAEGERRDSVMTITRIRICEMHGVPTWECPQYEGDHR